MSLLLRLNAASATTQFGSASVIAASPTGGRTGSVVLPRTPRTTGPYVAAQYSSFQGDGGNDGSAVTTGATQPGDQLFVTVADSQSNTAPTPPAGWTEVSVSDTDQGTNFENHFYLLNNPAASTTYTWTVVGGRRTITGLLIRGGVYENGDTLETATSTSHLSPTVVSQGPDRLAVAMLVNRSFPTCTWTENQAGSWDERVQTVGGDGVTNMQVSAQNKPVGPGNVSDTFLCANSEPAIIGLFLFGAGPGGRGIPVVPAQPLPKLAGTATILASRADPAAAAQDFPPRTIVLLATTRTPAGAALVLPRFDVEDVTPPRQTTVTAVRPPQPAGGAQVLAPHTDITPDTPCPAPVLSAGRPAGLLPGAVVVAGPRTDPATAQQDTGPRLIASSGVARPGVGTSAIPVTHTDPFNDPAQVGALVTTGRPPASSGSATVLASHADPITDPPTPSVAASTGRPPAYPGTVLLVGSHTDPFADPQPRPLIVGAAVRPPSGASLLLRSSAVPQPDSTPRLLVVAAGLRIRSGASSTTVQPGQPPVAGSGTSPVQLVVPAFVPRRVGSTNLAHVMHSCSVPRPSTGITTRPSSGATAYNLAVTARPSTGTTARPNTGTTVDPC